MHPFLIQFLTHFRLSPLQCIPNVFRVVMGMAVLMKKLGLNLTVHDITYVYRLQVTGRKKYTLVARNSNRKLVTVLSDSNKGQDEDFLVITGNWQNPFFSCPLILGEPSFRRFTHFLFYFIHVIFLPWLIPLFFLSDKEFTAKNVTFVERKTVEHLLKRPYFIDTGGHPRSTPILLDYVPSYKSFQKGPTMKDSR